MTQPQKHSDRNATLEKQGSSESKVQVSVHWEDELRAFNDARRQNTLDWALWRVKRLHKQFNSEASAQLLIDVQIERIKHALKEGQEQSARNIRDHLLAIFPQHPALKGLRNLICDERSFAELWAESDAQGRQALEDELCRKATDLKELAAFVGLPSDHSIRRTAAALQNAFESASNGALEVSALVFPEISRKSPFAPWLYLIRAIASYQRKDDETCRSCLLRIPPDSVPYRAAVPLKAALDAAAVPSTLKPAARKLVELLRCETPELKSALAEFDRVLLGENEIVCIGFSQQIARMVHICADKAPHLSSELRRWLCVLTIANGAYDSQIRKSIGVFPNDARFWRDLALHLPQSMTQLAIRFAWHRYLQAAIAEGLFLQGSPTHIGILLRMATMHENVQNIDERERLATYIEVLAPRRHQEILKALFGSRTDIPLEHYWIDREKIYEKASTYVADLRIYEAWYESKRLKGCSRQEQIEFLKHWHMRMPGEIKPVLKLMYLAMDRNAHKQAATYYKIAERIDPLHKDLRPYKLGIVIDSVIMHLRNRKQHLLAQDREAINQLNAIPAADREILLSIVDWCIALCTGITGAAQDALKRAVSLVGRRCAVYLMQYFYRVMGEPSSIVEEHLQLPGTTQGVSAQALLRAVGVMNKLLFSAKGFLKLNHEILRAELRFVDEVDPNDLKALIDQALSSDFPDLAYRGTEMALQKKLCNQAEIFLFRAKCFPKGHPRRIECLNIAYVLAQREGNADVLQNARIELNYEGISLEGKLDEDVFQRVYTRELSGLSGPTFSNNTLPHKTHPPVTHAIKDDKHENDAVTSGAYTEEGVNDPVPKTRNLHDYYRLMTEKFVETLCDDYTRLTEFLQHAQAPRKLLESLSIAYEQMKARDMNFNFKNFQKYDTELYTEILQFTDRVLRSLGKR